MSWQICTSILLRLPLPVVEVPLRAVGVVLLLLLLLPLLPLLPLLLVLLLVMEVPLRAVGVVLLLLLLLPLLPQQLLPVLLVLRQKLGALPTTAVLKCTLCNGQLMAAAEACGTYQLHPLNGGGGGRLWPIRSTDLRHAAGRLQQHRSSSKLVRGAAPQGPLSLDVP